MPSSLLFRDEDGAVKFDLHFIRQAPKVGQEYRGYKLEEDVLEALNRTGNAGRLVNLVTDYRTREMKPCYLSKDPITNECSSSRRPGPPPAQDKGLCAERQGVCRLRRRKRGSHRVQVLKREGVPDLHPDERGRARYGIPVGKKHEEAGKETGAGTGSRS